MTVKMLKKTSRDKTDSYRYAASLNDAYKKGYFGSGMAYQEFCDRMLKPNPELKIHNGKTYTGLFDTENNYYVCGISRTSRIPRFTLLKRDISKERSLNYSTEYGDITSRQTINQDEENGKVLARSWISVFNILKRSGYEVNDQDIDY